MVKASKSSIESLLKPQHKKGPMAYVLKPSPTSSPPLSEKAD
jgi:hypothetical protein